MCVWTGEVDTTRAEERYSSLAGLAEEFPAIRSSRITLAHLRLTRPSRVCQSVQLFTRMLIRQLRTLVC
jgi:hypothetical protein